MQKLQKLINQFFLLVNHNHAINYSYVNCFKNRYSSFQNTVEFHIICLKMSMNLCVLFVYYTPDCLNVCFLNNYTLLQYCGNNDSHRVPMIKVTTDNSHGSDLNVFKI